MRLSAKRIPHISRGDVITARYLQGLEQGILDAQRIQAPRQLDKGQPNPGDGTEVEAESGQTWNELSRSNTTITLTNAADPADTVDIDRAVTITFSTPTGSVQMILSAP